MKKNVLITVGGVLLLIAMFICACGSSSTKVEESIQDNESTEYSIPDSAFHQTTAKSIDKVLSESFERYCRNVGDCSYDDEIYALAFEKLLIHYLSSPITLNNTLDTLETLMEIRQSPDKKIKFYSWDDRTGGTYRFYKSFAQYKGIENTICYLEDAHFESEILKVHEITEGQSTYYLTLGHGHCGCGLDRNEVNLFKIDGNRLIRCKAFNNGETTLCVPYPEGDKGEIIEQSSGGWNMGRWNMEYNNVTKTLSFEDYLYGAGDCDIEYKGIKKLKFSNGKFNEI
jgi:hypothetical protein